MLFKILIGILLGVSLGFNAYSLKWFHGQKNDYIGLLYVDDNDLYLRLQEPPEKLKGRYWGWITIKHGPQK